MPVEFISATHTTPTTEASVGHRPRGFDVEYTRAFVRALDDGGFDWTLVPYGSSIADAEQVAQLVLHNSERVKPIVAQRPGFVYPTRAAKAFAALDQIGRGRLGVHIIAGSNDAEQLREGDRLDKGERYARAAEYIEILRRVWTAEEPFSYHGTYYSFEDFSSDVAPYQDTIPISVGGSSPEAYEVGGTLGDIFGLWGEPLAQTAQQIAAVHEIADAAGRPRPRIWISFRPIVAATDELAWEKARGILGRIAHNTGQLGVGATSPVMGSGGTRPENVGTQRLLAVAAQGERHDRALWTPQAAVNSASGSTTALVGSYETVAQALLDYVDIGCELLSIRGYDALEDAVDYARHLLPLVRQELARRTIADTVRA